MKKICNSTHATNHLAISLIIVVMALLCFAVPIYAQWTTHFIDQDLDAAYAVFVADMDNDNDLDVIATGYDADDVVWYEAPSWTKHFIDQILDGAAGVYVADMDDDNNLDVIATGYDADAVVWYESSVGVEEETALNQPSVISLAQPFPNPFSQNTVIEYELLNAAPITLKIYNISGQLVRTLINTQQTQGHKTVTWNGRDNAGERVSPGVYFLKFTMGDTDLYNATRKLLVTR